MVLGLHATRYDVSLSAPAIGTSSAKTTAPLPTLGFYGAYAFSPKLLLTGRIDFFGLNYGDYSGHLRALNAGLQYQLFNNVGLGVGYRYIDTDLSVSKPNLRAEFSEKYSGPTVYVNFSF